MSLLIPPVYRDPTWPNAPSTIDRLASSSWRFANFGGRINAHLAHASTSTNSTFVVPSNIGDTVTIPLTSTTNVRVGDQIVVGAQAGYYEATAKAGSSITFRSFRKGAYVTATIVQAGQFVVDCETPATFTTTSGTFTIPEVFNNSSATVSVATAANITVGHIYRISLYAGTYDITAVGVGNCTGRLRLPGDIPAGQTVPSGREVVTCALLGWTKPSEDGLWQQPLYHQWVPIDQLYVASVSQTGATATSATIAIGWSAANAAELATFTFGPASTVVADRYRLASYTAQDGRRLGVPALNPVFARVTTASTSTSWVAHAFMRGLYSA